MARPSPALVACALALAAPSAEPAGALQASTATLVVPENFRASPNGAIIGRLEQGTEVALVGSEGRWLEVELSGFVWSESIAPGARSGFDLVVSAEGGENLRAAPRGEIIARLEEGALLAERGREPSWFSVARRGYLWAESARVSAESPPRLAGESASLPGGSAAVVIDSPGEETSLAANPGGEVIAQLAPATPLVVTGRRGGWLRVRLEGWVWLPAGELAGEAAAAGAGPSLDEFAAAPESFVGRRVSWPLRFVAVERSTPAQIDFMEGESYLITTGDGGEPFVYVALSDDQLGLASGLAPLEGITVTGSVRTAASSLTGVPIIDLLAIERR